jgi:hypothetical protein
MSRTEFFPYPVAESALRLDYQLQSEQLQVEHGRILATGVPEPDSLKLSLMVEMDEGTYERVLPTSELPDPPVDVMVSVRSIQSRERRTVPMNYKDGGWRGVFDVPKRELYGELLLEPALVRNKPGSDGGFAEHRGAVLATGDPVKVIVDEPPLTAGGFIEIKWENFRTCGRPVLEARPRHLYLLDTDHDTPILWLNEDVRELKPVLHATGPRGYNLRVRDAMFDTIVSQVWTSLASLAFTSLALVIRENEEDDEIDPIDLLPEWQRQVIGFWAPRMFSLSRQEAIERVKEIAPNRASLPELVDLLSAAVQVQAGTRRAFEGLIRMRDREGV